jgi:NAD(P)-dependent dehydrogenase (short-subunit alcohol dehydrogenase family)
MRPEDERVGTTEAFAGRVAIVTGAGSGIGAEVARELARRGAEVVATDRRPDRVAGHVQAWGQEEAARTTVQPLDVTDRSAFEALVQQVRERRGRLDLLVNNAGVVRPPRPLSECSDDDWDHVMGVNAKGVFNGLAAALPVMFEQGAGVVLNVGSVTAVKSVAGMGVYGASKAAVTALTRSAALEAGPHGVRVNELQPGPTLTPMVTGRSDAPTGAEEAFARAVPLGRVSTPAEQTAAALFLLSDEASYVNGASLLVDGGLAWV